MRRLAVVLLVLAGLGAGVGSASADDPPEFSQTKTLTRDFQDADGNVTAVDTRTVTVDVAVTSDLRARQELDVSWTGAHPSGSRSADPRAEKGLPQEYPVVVLQCRGSGDEVVPETCWTSFFKQRSDAVGAGQSVWRHDLYATPEQREEQSARPDWPADCTPNISFLDQYAVPFRAAGGTVYDVCSAETEAPEMGFNGALPPNDLAAYTRLDGTGRTDFDVRTNVENESLGCSSTTPCSLVVIPIMGMSCVDANAECRRTGKAAPGSSYDVSTGFDLAVSPAYWWAPSNWRNRFVVPLTFQPPPAPCSALGQGAPVDFFGSELLSQASVQWAPAYCLDASRFTYRHNRMSESVAFSTMLRGSGVAALVSDKQEAPPDVPVGYAPVAVTGFAIAYVLDQPDNAGPVTDLRLTPRLLAKLLTQSYLGSDLGRGHEGMAGNPWSLNQDPEFLALNPGVNQAPTETMATLLSLSVRSDVMAALTAYLDADPDAAAFLAGTPDEHGMVVNPSYKGVEVPTREWGLQDTYVPDYALECQKANFAESPYFSQIAAPVSSLATIAEAVLDAQPNVQTRCDRSTSSDPWKLGRIDPQNWGSRGMLGVVSLGDAVRYGLRTAALRTTGTTFVTPDDASLAAAVSTATQSAPGEPFLLDAGTVRQTSGAYPGTMIVHAASRLSGMSAADAADAAAFVTIATTEGQVRGTGVGQLPDGYLPITSGSATGPLLASATKVAAAVKAQSGALGAPVSTPPHVPVPPTTASVTAPVIAPPAAVVPAGPGTETVTGQPADPAPAAAGARPAARTEATPSGPGAHSLPIALGAGALAFLGAPLIRRIPTRAGRP
ncbi:hypothetical protein [Cellulomonas sp. ICMP 17802]|uniref:hypothetical protein n=1 Tax=Cellulomonas sp. ICMP 17802 TaxID=3239199 RepID=UPI00351BD9CC